MRRVSRGSMMPSSHSRAVPKSAALSASSRWRSASLIAASASSLAGRPMRPSLLRLTMSITLAACAPPITAVRALGQAKMKRGSKPRPHMP